MNMFAIKFSVFVVMFIGVSSLQDSLKASQEKPTDSLIRLQRHGFGGWHRPFYFKNHNHWSKDNSHSTQDLKTNQNTQPNLWSNKVVYSHNNTTNTRPNKNEENFNPLTYNSPYQNKFTNSTRQTVKPNMKSTNNSFGRAPNTFLPISEYVTSSQKPNNIYQNGNQIGMFNNSIHIHNQIKPNYHKYDLKPTTINRTILEFNRTNIITQMHKNNLRPKPTLTTYSYNEPNMSYWYEPGKGNRTDFSKIKTDQIQEARETHDVLKTDHHTNNPNSIHKLTHIHGRNKSSYIDAFNYSKKEITIKTNDDHNIPTKEEIKFAGNLNTISVTDDIMNSPFGKLDVPTPDFLAPGRRISEKKCYEYLWYLKRRLDDSLRRWKRDVYIRNGHSLLSSKGSKEEQSTTLGGRDTIPGEFPHMGALGWTAKNGTWIFKCGSSLISHKFVLSAAHCSRSPLDPTIAYPDPKIVRLGDKNIVDVFANDHAPFDVKILRIINHPKYSSPKQYYDIALVELEKEVEFTKYIHPACLWTSLDTSRLVKEATLTGWGVIESAGLTTSPELQAAVVDILDTNVCNQLLRSSFNRNWCGFRDHQICAGKLAGGVDACQGDSGGPLQVKIPLPSDLEGSMHFVIGVISFGVKCARPRLPGIYTRVASFIDWIEKIVWPLS